MTPRQHVNPDYPYADEYLQGRTPAVEVPPEICPCCARGKIVAGTCERCHVAIAEGSVERPVVQRTSKRRRADQNDLRPMGDYVATKRDQA